MQEVFEQTVKDFADMYEDAIRHTDVVALLKDLKLQRALAENLRLRTEHFIYHLGNRVGCIDPSDEDAEVNLHIEAAEFARIVETFDYVIDVIESGKFAKESDSVKDLLKIANDGDFVDLNTDDEYRKICG